MQSLQVIPFHGWISCQTVFKLASWNDWNLIKICEPGVNASDRIWMLKSKLLTAFSSLINYFLIELLFWADFISTINVFLTGKISCCEIFSRKWTLTCCLLCFFNYFRATSDFRDKKPISINSVDGENLTRYLVSCHLSTIWVEFGALRKFDQVW